MYMQPKEYVYKYVLNIYFLYYTQAFVHLVIKLKRYHIVFLPE